MKKSILILELFIFIIGFGAVIQKNGEAEIKNNNIVNITAITEVFRDGQKTTGAVIEYGEEIDGSKLSKSTFSVENRTVLKVYTSNKPEKSLRGTDGKYIIIELSPDDKDALTFINIKNSSTPVIKKEKKVTLTQEKDIITVNGEKYSRNSRAVSNNKEQNFIVDDFIKLEYKDLKTGKTLKYNLYIPKNYDRSKSYPLVTFIHDAGTVGTESDITLIQGIGGVIWADPEEQAKHESFVLAPQYPFAIVNDNFEITDEGDITINLINSLIDQYSIDKNRLYITGQSMGCMTSIALNIKYPDMFAASFLVAGQWNPDAMTVLAHNKMWIVVSEGDQKAFPGMNASLEKMKAAGAVISTEFWDGQAGNKEMEKNVNQMIKKNADIKYTVFKNSTVVPKEAEQNSGNNHRYTWQKAYTIEGIRDWLFTQTKKTN